MAQCRHALKPDGLFLAAMFGGQTLQVREGCGAGQPCDAALAYFLCLQWGCHMWG